MTDIDRNFLAEQIKRLLANDARQQGDMTVLTAMVMRLDGTMAALLEEIRAMHAQIAWMNDRVRSLEDAGR
jgi:hypothetical protein